MHGFLDNLILNTDSYKASHYLQYPPGTEEISSYVESRGGRFPHTLFFGLQAFIKQYLLTPITHDDIGKAEALLTAHGLPFNRAGWLRIVNDHGGHLPIEIAAVAEGEVVPTHNALVQVRNTDPGLAWVTSYIETALLRAIWYPTTVATLSFEAKRVIRRHLDRTSDDPDGQIPFKLHDFGARGVSSLESAMLGGMAHLVNFQGTDTLSAILGARRYYDAAMAGFSIPAAEHSTITAWGHAREAEAYANMIAQFGKPGKLVAVVSDSYDVFNAVSELWGKKLKDQVLRSGATLVVRPDSGNPSEVVVEVARRLAMAFGASTNKAGYAVLNPSVRIIQGDGMDLDQIDVVLNALTGAGFSAENVAFGMGGGLLQQVDRDTLKWAMKASAIKIDGMWRDVYKNPVTDRGKVSKKGRLALVRDAGGWRTVPAAQARDDRLIPAYRDGKLLNETDFDAVRARADAALKSLNQT
ncbi:MAG TPA: nicotinate phosphoribosyltransferase [Alphaproteobacteria bacterium]|jgi:nicotinamide phosphoribosyltransferase|nr:nicotinate phosphoribosyltransferase [Alphaproteobacteria bacterium]